MKLIKEKVKKIIIKILSILTTLILINIPLLICLLTSTILVSWYYACLKKYQEPILISGILISLLPAILFIILRILLFKKNKKVKVKVHILGLLFIPIAVILYAYTAGNLVILGVCESLSSDKYPSISEYSTEVKKIAEEYQIRHFPVEIPYNAQNYFFEIEKSFDGYNISYLRFNIDDEYIDKVIAENKDRIYKEMPYKKMIWQYKHIDSTLTEEIPYDRREPYTAYILKNENNDDWYTSGFIVSKEQHKIIYFYANYNLEINHKKKDNKQNSV